MFRTDELSETCRVSSQNKFVKLVYLFSFITKKCATKFHTHAQQQAKLHFCISSYFLNRHYYIYFIYSVNSMAKLRSHRYIHRQSFASYGVEYEETGFQERCKTFGVFVGWHVVLESVRLCLC
jgi:hypothetical protein